MWIAVLSELLSTVNSLETEQCMKVESAFLGVVGLETGDLAGCDEVLKQGQASRSSPACKCNVARCQGWQSIGGRLGCRMAGSPAC